MTTMVDMEVDQVEAVQVPVQALNHKTPIKEVDLEDQDSEGQALEDLEVNQVMPNLQLNQIPSINTTVEKFIK